MTIFTHPPQRGFAPEDMITGCIAGSNNFDPYEDLESAGGFVLFDGAVTRVWLIATRLRLYNIIDDRREKGPRINWSISRSRLYKKGAIILEVREDSKGKDLVDIGYRKGCAFSPGLFAGVGLKERILALLKEKMG